MSEITEPESPPKGMNEIQRLAGVIWEPRPVFQDLAARPRWWVPLILLTLVSVGYLFALSSIVGWGRFMRHQFETNPRLQQLPIDQQARIIEQQVKIGSKVAYGAAAAGIAGSCLVIAAVLLGVFNYFGGASLKFRQAFAITTYSSLPSGLATILSLVVMVLKDPEEFDLQNPLVLNVGAFLDPSATPKWIQSVGASLDLFSLWVILLLALGFSVAARTTSFSSAVKMVLLPWAAWVLVKSGWASMFG